MTQAVPADLFQARILLSNDDGVAAPGLKALERIARGLSRQVWVVAPELEQSGAGHSLTMRRPLRLRHVGRRRHAVDGTPTDSVLLAINHVLKKQKPHLVLSGVNRGSNLGEDVTYSGTIAAAMEATLLGTPAIALSLAIGNGKSPRWDTAERHAPEIIRRLVATGWPRDVLINVNFPDCAPDDVKGVRVAAQGRRKIGDELGVRVDLRGEHYFWIGPMRENGATVPDSDIGIVQAGYIAVTPLHLDMTHFPTADALRVAFQ